ncbi:hypothetical protein QUB68_20425 [Microcoleus sp. A006_D1]|uniref:hypothetical protein n=1 Tax=Microcoleus sp. A006_D1 TaxID=3055267 RepID=UPI002FD3F7E2
MHSRCPFDGCTMATPRLTPTHLWVKFGAIDIFLLFYNCIDIWRCRLVYTYRLCDRIPRLLLA